MRIKSENLESMSINDDVGSISISNPGDCKLSDESYTTTVDEESYVKLKEELSNPSNEIIANDEDLRSDDKFSQNELAATSTPQLHSSNDEKSNYFSTVSQDLKPYPEFIDNSSLSDDPVDVKFSTTVSQGCDEELAEVIIAKNDPLSSIDEKFSCGEYVATPEIQLVSSSDKNFR